MLIRGHLQHTCRSKPPRSGETAVAQIASANHPHTTPATPAPPAPTAEPTPNIDATVEAAISATKTAEKVEPNLTLDMIQGLLERYYEVNSEAGTTLESGGVCLTTDQSWNGMYMSNRMRDFKKSFDPKRIGREWELQVTGRYCNGIEYFYINDVTGELWR